MHANPSTEVTEDQKMRSIYRAHLVIIIWVVVAVVALIRSFYVQVIKHNDYVALADKQYVSSTPVNFDRGVIYFSHYQKDPVLAAEIHTVYRIAIDTTVLIDKEKVFYCSF